jgi:hypothetical protein
VAREDLVYLLDQFLRDADGNESASVADGSTQEKCGKAGMNLPTIATLA